MTGLERMIQKVSNATALALVGQRPGLTVESWSLEELRRAALEQRSGGLTGPCGRTEGAAVRLRVSEKVVARPHPQKWGLAVSMGKWEYTEMRQDRRRIRGNGTSS